MTSRAVARPSSIRWSLAIGLLALGLLWVAHGAWAAPPPTEFAASFVQTRTLPGFDQPIVSHGSLHFSKGGGFRWQINKPYHYVFAMHDGKAHEELPDGTRRELAPDDTPWLKVVQRVFVAALAGNRDDLKKYFELRVQPLDDGRHVTLVPDSDALAKVIQRIEVTESAPGRPRHLVVEETSGARMDVRFTPLADARGGD